MSDSGFIDSFNDTPLVIDLSTNTKDDNEKPNEQTQDSASIDSSDLNSTDKSDQERIKLELFKDICLIKSNKLLSIELCFKLLELIEKNKLNLTDLDDKSLIDALKDLDENDDLKLFDDYFNNLKEEKFDSQAFIDYCSDLKKLNPKEEISIVKTSDNNLTLIEEKLKEIQTRTGYSFHFFKNSRLYGGPPPKRILDLINPNSNNQSMPSLKGCECYIGRLPHDIFEDELIPILEKQGIIWDLRIFFDPYTGYNKSYAFVTFCEAKSAELAVKNLNNYEIRFGRKILVRLNTFRHKLFVKNIPRYLTKEEIKEEFNKKLDGLIDVYIPDGDFDKNRGYCIIEFVDNRTASAAKVVLSSPKSFIMSNREFYVEWLNESIEDEMSKTSVLYVKNMPTTIDEKEFYGMFREYGEIINYKRIRDFGGYVYFKERECAAKAKDELNNKIINDLSIKIEFAKAIRPKLTETSLVRPLKNRPGLLPTPLDTQFRFNNGPMISSFNDLDKGYKNTFKRKIDNDNDDPESDIKSKRYSNLQTFYDFNNKENYNETSFLKSSDKKLVREDLDWDN